MTYQVEDFQVIREGKAEILAPKEDKVFYNPIQQFNRDLSVMAINAWGQLREEKLASKRKAKKATETTAETTTEPQAETEAETATNGDQEESATKRAKVADGSAIPKESETKPKFEFDILEALSATGLRAIRYGHEIPGARRIVANDLLPDAVEAIGRSIEHNKLEDKVVPNLGDAIKYMGGGSQKFHVIDLDPYGTAAPFVDGAIQSIEDEGLLLVTCTDAGVLAGSGYPEKCFALYGGNNFGNGGFINGESNHEAGLRLILHMIATTAAKYKKSIEPILSLSIDFYMRCFIRVRTAPIEVKQLSSKTMIAYGCNGCGHKELQPLGRVTGKKYQYPKLARNMQGGCVYCDSFYTVAGPMWLGPLHNHEFIDRVLKINSEADKSVYGTTERIKGMLTLARSELPDQPFYFNLNQLSSIFKTSPISINEFVRALGGMGYQVSLTHAKTNCVKTDAPWKVILQIKREWLKKGNQEHLEQIDSGKVKVSEKNETKVQQIRDDIYSSPNLGEGTVGHKLLQRVTDSLKVDFVNDNDVSREINRLRKVKMVRYQENPTKNWGPKSRPGK